MALDFPPFPAGEDLQSSPVLGWLERVRRRLNLSDTGWLTGTWTPVLTFQTPGDLSVAYTTQVGTFIKIGRLVIAQFQILTSTFTFTTASGTLRVTGFPYTAGSLTGSENIGALKFSGITKVGYTNFVAQMTIATTRCLFRASGSAVAEGPINATDTPTTGTVLLGSTLSYLTD